MNKRILAIILTVLMLIGIPSALAVYGDVVAVANGDITISVNGRTIDLKDASGNTVEPFLIDGTVYVPYRAVSEGLGYDVRWDGTNSEVIIGNALTPKYIFYMIGDGMGASHRQLGEFYMQYKTDDKGFQLAMNDMPVASSFNTHSASSYVTDSGAAGTALATGKKTDNRIVSMTPDGKPLTTIAQALQAEGMGIGLLTTVSVTHATPASFGANIMDRDDEAGVAEQYLEAEWDFLAGGGINFFAEEAEGGKRAEGDSLLDDFANKGYEIDLSLEDYQDTDFSQVDKYLGLYEPKYLTMEIAQINGTRTSPTLAQMTQNAIDVLVRNPNGFFMMVEGGQIDGAAHNNDTPTTLWETLTFDNAVQVAVDFYNAYPDDTLIIVTADHETGGLTIGYNSYSANFEKLDGLTSAWNIDMEPYAVQKDYDGLFAAIEKGWQITLTDADKALITDRLENFDLVGMAADFGLSAEEAQSMDSMKHMFGIAGYAASPVLAQYTRISWSTQAHSGEPVPLTAIGAGSMLFTASRDNTDVANILAGLMGVKIG